MFFILYLLRIFGQQCIRASLKIAVPASILAAAVKITDVNLKWNYMKDIMPHNNAFGIFAGTVSFLLVFRTVQALNMYIKGASAAYHMTGAWFDAASSLFAFTRVSTARADEVQKFKNTLIRLFSLMSMLCLQELENCEDLRSSHAMNFSVIDAEGLDPTMMAIIKNSKCKAEVVLQIIQCHIVDNIATILPVPPPILTRAFQDLGNGMLQFHETLHISRVSIPFPLNAATQCLLFAYALFTAFTMALWAQGPLGAAWITFVQVAVFFTLNELACEIENPFSGRFKDLRMEHIHHQMNLRLASLHSLPASFETEGSGANGSSGILNVRKAVGAVWEPLDEHSVSSSSLEFEARGSIRKTFFPRLLARTRSGDNAKNHDQEKAQTYALASVLGENVHETAPRGSTRSNASFSVVTANDAMGRSRVLSLPVGASFKRTYTSSSAGNPCPADVRDPNSAGLDNWTVPGAPEHSTSPRCGGGSEMDRAAGPTASLAMSPCSDRPQKSFHDEPSRALFVLDARAEAQE